MLVSFLLTILATAVLVGHLPSVGPFADAAAKTPDASRAGLCGELLQTSGVSRVARHRQAGCLQATLSDPV